MHFCKNYRILVSVIGIKTGLRYCVSSDVQTVSEQHMRNGKSGEFKSLLCPTVRISESIDCRHNIRKLSNKQK